MTQENTTIRIVAAKRKLAEAAKLRKLGSDSTMGLNSHHENEAVSE